LTTFVENFSSVFESNKKLKTADLKEADILNTYILAAFHTFFNIINVLLLIWFVPWLVKMAIKTVPDNEEEDNEDGNLKFIGGGLLTPELATIELQKETAHFGEVTARMSGFAKTLINSTDAKEQKKMLKKLKKYEKITDKMEIEITEYMTKLSSKEITPKTSLRLRSTLNICNDLERIGDIYFQISKAIERKIEDKNYFLPEQKNNLNEMIETVDNAFAIMVKNLNSPSYDDVSKDEAKAAEKAINAMRNKLRKHNNKRVGDEDYNSKTAMIYNNVFSSLEKAGDHIINVTEAVIGEI